MKPVSKARKFLSFSFADRNLLTEAWMFQVATGILLKTVPFKKIPGYFKNPPGDLNSPSGEEICLQKIREATVIAGHYSFWRNRCLVQSLAARWMLRRRGITSHLSLGVARDKNGKTIAHAWINSGDIEIVNSNGNCLEMFTF